MSNKNLRPGRLTWLAVVLAVLALCQPVLAQSTAVLQGTVTDPSGGALKDAKVTVKNIATGQERTVQTDEQGNYTFSALPAGT